MQVRETELSILFSDIRGFTGISEILGPRELGLYINEYLSAMSHVIRIDFHGTLDKFIGDAVMAFWGAPLDDRDHAIHAIKAAMGMQRAVIELNRSFAAKGWPSLKIGVGICTGMVRVGDMGSIERRAYTAMGNAVNTASRLEARTKHYSIGILVSEQTVLQAPEITFREVDLVQLKGQTQPVRIYEPVVKMDEMDAEQENLLQQWRQFLVGYRKKDWATSAMRLKVLRQARPEDGLFAYYQSQLESIRGQNLPEDWDGVTVFNEK
jgi:adenylate cyclase